MCIKIGTSRKENSHLDETETNFPDIYLVISRQIDASKRIEKIKLLFLSLFRIIFQYNNIIATNIGQNIVNLATYLIQDHIVHLLGHYDVFHVKHQKQGATQI